MSGLPSQETRRWVKSRKLAVVLAIMNGTLSREGAMSRYKISEDELDSWIWSANKHGPDSLCVTKTQKYERKPIA